MASAPTSRNCARVRCCANWSNGRNLQKRVLQTIPTIKVAEVDRWQTRRNARCGTGADRGALCRWAWIIRATSMCCPMVTFLSPKLIRPPRDGGGIEGMVMRWLMNKAGRRGTIGQPRHACCVTPMATASAELKAPFHHWPEFTVRHGAGGGKVVCRQYRCILLIPVSRKAIPGLQPRR